MRLGQKVLEELPYNSPKICDNYGVNIKDNPTVRLLLQSPIAVAESIKTHNINNSIWGGDEMRERIRRNIQYSQYVFKNSCKPSFTEFYSRLILHALKNN
jgi:hypothetical protein